MFKEKTLVPEISGIINFNSFFSMFKFKEIQNPRYNNYCKKYDEATPSAQILPLKNRTSQLPKIFCILHMNAYIAYECLPSEKFGYMLTLALEQKSLPTFHETAGLMAVLSEFQWKK